MEQVFHAVTLVRFFKGIQGRTECSGLCMFAKQSTRSLVTSFPAIWPVNSFSSGHEVTAPSSVMAPMSSSGWQRARAPWPPPLALTFLRLAVAHLKLQLYFTTSIPLTSHSFLHRLNIICSGISLLTSFGEAVMDAASAYIYYVQT